MDNREKILDQLAQFYANDRISVDEYERRVGAVMSAATEDEARRVNLDLLGPGPGRVETHSILPLQGEAFKGPSKDVTAIFSSTALKGWFEAPPYITAAAIFGESTIDLREAVLPAGGVTIEAAAIFGGITIRVPPNVRLHVEGTPIFGGIEQPPHSGNPAGIPIIVKASAIFGGIEIKFPKK